MVYYPPKGEYIINRRLYSFRNDDIQHIVLDEKETINVKWVSKKDLQVMIENQNVVRFVA